MNIESFIPFVLASALILVIPGPTVILVITQAVAYGRKSVIPLAAGVMLGDFTAMTCSLLGLGALLAASAALFILFKWIGALYLFYLGIKMLRSNPMDFGKRQRARNLSPWALFRSSYIVTALNPKSIAFFVGFLPQFIDPHLPMIPQMSLLGGTFLILATISSSLYAVFAGRLSELTKKERVRKWFNRCGGGALIGAAVVTAGVQHSS